jgi:hypothetical protein
VFPAQSGAAENFSEVGIEPGLYLFQKRSAITPPKWLSIPGDPLNIRITHRFRFKNKK